MDETVLRDQLHTLELSLELAREHGDRLTEDLAHTENLVHEMESQRAVVEQLLRQVCDDAIGFPVEMVYLTTPSWPTTS
jgi:hypothetical protein